MVLIDLVTVHAALTENEHEIHPSDEVPVPLKDVAEIDGKTTGRAKRQKKISVVTPVESVKAPRAVAARKANSQKPEPEIPPEVLKRLELHNNRMIDFANELVSLEW